MFAGLAARRKGLEDRRRTVARSLGTQSQKKGGLTISARRDDAGLAQQALRDMARVLSSDAVPGREKRDLVGRIIARVVCRPDGADVYYLPGAFPAASPFANSMLTELMQ